MSMSTTPTRTGGRVIQGDTPYGKYEFHVERSGSGKRLRLVDDDGVEHGTGEIDICDIPAAEVTVIEQLKDGGCRRGCGQVKRRIHGAVSLAKAVLQIDRAPDRLIVQRREICRDCAHAIPCPGSAVRNCRCRLCNCVLGAKTSLAGETCPAGLW